MTTSNRQAMRERARQARLWLFSQSLPLWSRVGRDHRWGFAERLDMSALPIPDACTRVRVQARQTYSFAHAAMLGWNTETSRELIRHGVEALLVQCRHANGLYGRSINFESGATEDRSDLYDCAFVLLALSWASHALRDAGLAREAGKLGAAIDSNFRHAEGGYHAFLPPGSERWQNPHMHLLEASLAHAKFSGSPASMQRCAGIIDFVQRSFLDDRGRLHEGVYPEGWPHAEDRFEAGHQFEWVWLLLQWSKFSGEPVHDAVQRLYSFGNELTDANGRIALSHHTDTCHIRKSFCRCWSQTEALKAHLALLECGDGQEAEPALRCFDRLWEDHIASAPAGAWIDMVSEAGAPLSTDIPASTFYHLLLALSEWIRVTELLH